MSVHDGVEPSRFAEAAQRHAENVLDAVNTGSRQRLGYYRTCTAP